MASIKDIKDGNGDIYQVTDNEDGTWDCSCGDKVYKVSLTGCSCTGFKYRANCKHFRWVLTNEKSLYKQDLTYEKVKTLHTNFFDDLYKAGALAEAMVWGAGGSFERRCKTVRDLDLILASDKKENVEQLKQHVMQVFKHTIAIGDKIIRGIYAKKDKHIQIDIHICSTVGYEAFQLYLTGSPLFTDMLRRKAGKLKLKLTEQGLFGFDEIKNENSILVANKEQDIFEMLGVEYVPHSERGQYVP